MITLPDRAPQGLSCGTRKNGTSVGGDGGKRANGPAGFVAMRCLSLLFIAMRCLALPKVGEGWQRNATQCKCTVYNRPDRHTGTAPLAVKPAGPCGVRSRPVPGAPHAKLVPFFACILSADFALSGEYNNLLSVFPGRCLLKKGWDPCSCTCATSIAASRCSSSWWCWPSCCYSSHSSSPQS